MKQTQEKSIEQIPFKSTSSTNQNKIYGRRSKLKKEYPSSRVLKTPAKARLSFMTNYDKDTDKF